MSPSDSIPRLTNEWDVMRGYSIKVLYVDQKDSAKSNSEELKTGGKGVQFFETRGRFFLSKLASKSGHHSLSLSLSRRPFSRGVRPRPQRENERERECPNQRDVEKHTVVLELARDHVKRGDAETLTLTMSIYIHSSHLRRGPPVVSLRLRVSGAL